MEKLNYQTLKNSGYSGYLLEEGPVRALQFGEGGFLRAFVDYFIDVMNERAGFNCKVTVVQPIAQGLGQMLDQQQGLYTLYLRGVQHGKEAVEKRVISSIANCINPYEDYKAFLDCAKNKDLRFLFSNTTEAGIVYDENSLFDQQPPASFPAKLTRFLYERYQLNYPGFIILSCELIDDNGKELESCVLNYCDQWELSDAFKQWVKEENVFCSTLVDRIVTGYPRNEAEALNKENGYIDQLLDTGEIFGLWVVEGPDFIKDELPFEKAGLPILVTKDHSPYKQRKVRILNGAHTAMAPGAFMAGIDTVLDCMEDPCISNYMNHLLYDEIIPTLTLPEKEVQDFAKSVSDRFKNPYIRHELLSIALNSTAKWKARLMPSLTAYYEKKRQLPKHIVFSFAACLWFYRGGRQLQNETFIGQRPKGSYEIKDDLWVLTYFDSIKDAEIPEFAKAVIENEQMWGSTLKELTGFLEMVIQYLNLIDNSGMKDAFSSL